MVPIAHAVDAVLQEIYDAAESDTDLALTIRETIPLSTGITSLDRLLGGGIRRGQVLVLEADLAAVGAAVAYTIARGAPHRRMLDAYDMLVTTEWLMAGSSGLAWITIDNGSLTGGDWDRVVEGLDSLNGQELFLSDSGSSIALEGALVATCADLMVVHEAERFGSPVQFLTALTNTAVGQDTAVVATTAPMGELPDWALERITRVAVVDFELGGRAVLARADPDALLEVAHLRVECLTGAVSDL